MKLEQAVERDPSNAMLLSDLSVAYLTQAMQDENEYSLALALDASGRALRQAPDLSEAHFNHALILERLFLWTEAQQAWESFLKLDPSSVWAREAEQHLNIIRIPLLHAKWKSEQLPLERAAVQRDQETVNRIVDCFPQYARVYAQGDLLQGWAEAYLAKNTGIAAQRLLVSRSIAYALARRGEHSVADAVLAIEQAETEAGLDMIAHGHLAYTRGILEYEELEIDSAVNSLTQAHIFFRNGGNVSGALWAEFWLGGLEYYSGRQEIASAKFLSILERSDLKRYPALKGRIYWALGLMELVRARPGESLHYYQSGLAEFLSLEEHENKGAMEALISESLDRLGAQADAWKYRHQSLQALHHYPDSVRLHNLLLETAERLRSDGLLSAALDFQNEGLSVALRRKSPVSIADILITRGLIHHKLDEEAKASADLAQAIKHIEKVASGAVRRRLRIYASLAEAEAKSSLNPAVYLPSLSSTISYCREKNIFIHLPYAYLLRSKILLGLGEEDGAIEDLAAGIGVYESAVKEQDIDIAALVSYAEQSQPLFEQMIELQVRKKNYRSAFSFAERARSAMLQQAVARSIEETSAVEEILHKIPDGETIIEYVVLDNRVLVYVMQDGALETLNIDVSTDRLEKIISRFRRGVIDGDKQESAAELLFDILLRPVLEIVPRSNRLVIIPDKFISFIPFAALMNAQSGDYLIEEREISYSPSASIYFSPKRFVSQESAEWRLLAVGNPKVDTALESDVSELTDLPHAEREVLEISSLYNDHAVLIGEFATKREFLRLLSGADVFHFAGHASTNFQDNSLSKLVFASELMQDSDLFLYAHEIGSLPLGRLRLVVLSACETAPGSPLRSAGVSGISQAFIASGVPAVLAVNWKINDRVAGEIVAEFHRRIVAGDSGPSALRAAQLRILNEGGALGSMEDWAGFQYFGSAQNAL